MKSRWLAALVLLVLSSLACQTLAGSDTETPGNADTPVSEDVPAGTTMNLVFEDDFSSSASGWDTQDWDNGRTDYTGDGAYEIAVKNPQYDIWANPNLYFDGDVRLEADYTKIAGPSEDDIGLVCRYTRTDDAYSFYYAVVGSDGYAGVYKVLDGESSTLLELSPGSVKNVKGVNQVNHLRLDCFGDMLTLYVNGEKAISVNDSVDTLTAGDVGLLAGVFDTAGLVIHFDNFKVYTP